MRSAHRWVGCTAGPAQRAHHVLVCLHVGGATSSSSAQAALVACCCCSWLCVSTQSPHCAPRRAARLLPLSPCLLHLPASLLCSTAESRDCATSRALWLHRKKEIERCLQRAESFIRSIQRPDGSWYGSWAVCFTYGTWFGCCALAARGYSCESDEGLRRACDFLLSKQREDGGWGESYLSCQDKVGGAVKRGLLPLCCLARSTGQGGWWGGCRGCGFVSFAVSTALKQSATAVVGGEAWWWGGGAAVLPFQLPCEINRPSRAG